MKQGKQAKPCTSRGQGDGSYKAWAKQAAAAREGPEAAPAGREGRINVLPWYRPVCVAKYLQLDALRGGEEPGPHLSLPNSQPLSATVRRCARVTGKAGENGQYSGELGGSSPWTRPSAPKCGDTLKVLARYGSVLGENQGFYPGYRVAIDWFSSAGRFPLLVKR